jgi:hypothetical protein
MPDGPTTTDRENLEAVAAGYHQLELLRRQQLGTIAEMIRECLSRINRHQRPHEVGNWRVARKITQERTAAIAALYELCKMLDQQSVG